MKIKIQNLHPKRKITPALIKKRINKIVKKGGSKRTLNIYLVNDKEIKKLKKTFWGINKPTDVIAFEGERHFLGEIVISLDTASRQAKDRNIPLDWELTLLTLHGLLHLFGFSDYFLPEWRRMRIAEFENLVRIIN